MLDVVHVPWSVIEAAALDEFDDWLRRRDVDEDRRKRVKALFAQVLRESVAMLAAGSTTLH